MRKIKLTAIAGCAALTLGGLVTPATVMAAPSTSAAVSPAATPAPAQGEATNASPAAGCGADFSPTITRWGVLRASATWSVRCDGPDWVVVAGWVEDNATDSDCARVRFSGGGESASETVCGWGRREAFAFSFPGQAAEGRLMLVN